MPTGKERKIESFTMTFEGKPVLTNAEAPLDEMPPEYFVDTDNYSGDDYEEFINELKMRIAELKSWIRYLEGKCEAQEQFWKIWNGESDE